MDYEKTFLSKHYQLTVHVLDTYEHIRDYLIKLKYFLYLISCKEISPTTNKEHIHIYVQYSRKREISNRKCFNSHIEECRGTPIQNRDYIMKDGNILDEIGDFHSILNNNPTIDDVRLMSRKDRDKLPIRYYNQVKKINEEEDMMLSSDLSYKDNLVVEYIYGPSKIGKSRYVYEQINSKYNKMYDDVIYKDGFFGGISGLNKVCVLDDFRDSNIPVDTFIRFIDKRVHFLSVKHGYKKNIYTTIFITTIKSPDIIYERYKDIEERNQWLRRMVIKHFMFDPIKKRVYYEIEKMETTSQYFEGEEYKPIVSKEEMEQEDMKIESSSNI